MCKGWEAGACICCSGNAKSLVRPEPRESGSKPIEQDPRWHWEASNGFSSKEWHAPSGRQYNRLVLESDRSQFYSQLCYLLAL